MFILIQQRVVKGNAVCVNLIVNLLLFSFSVLVLGTWGIEFIVSQQVLIPNFRDNGTVLELFSIDHFLILIQLLELCSVLLHEVVITELVVLLLRIISFGL